jgi:hypothetical protein
MSDNHRRYYAIHEALRRLTPHAKGHRARHLVALAALICGIVGSKSSQLPAIASKTPGRAKRQSRITTWERWLNNKAITVEAYYLPFVTELLNSLPEGPLTLVIDGSVVGRHCMALVISVLHQGRALPLCWQIVDAKKGHLPQELHCRLVKQAQALLGSEREIVFLGDGEFDGTELLHTLEQAGWQYVCRTAKNTCLYEEGVEFSFAGLYLQLGDYVEIDQIGFTRARYAGVRAVAVWEEGYAEPLYLVTNLELGQEALLYYRKRYTIETFFSDQKSRGFHLADSHLRDPARLCRLMIATCLGYLWLVCLGVRVKQRGWLCEIHRRTRCDLSLFQIGLIWLEHCLNEGLAIWVAFRLPPIREPRSVSRGIP